MILYSDPANSALPEVQFMKAHRLGPWMCSASMLPRIGLTSPDRVVGTQLLPPHMSSTSTDRPLVPLSIRPDMKPRQPIFLDDNPTDLFPTNQNLFSSRPQSTLLFDYDIPINPTQPLHRPVRHFPSSSQVLTSPGPHPYAVIQAFYFFGPTTVFSVPCPGPHPYAVIQAFYFFSPTTVFSVPCTAFYCGYFPPRPTRWQTRVLSARGSAWFIFTIEQAAPGDEPSIVAPSFVNIIAWNCHGSGGRATILTLARILHSTKAHIAFISKTRCTSSQAISHISKLHLQNHDIIAARQSRC